MSSTAIPLLSAALFLKLSYACTAAASNSAASSALKGRLSADSSCA
jgi:hypothetical protein